MRRDITFILSIVFLLVLVIPAWAGRGFRQADKNKDGVVNRREWRMQKRQEHQRKIQAKNWWQRMADTDGNGVVDESEKLAWKKLLKERIDLNGDGKIDAKERRLCWRHARSKVNTALETRYDRNSNGWLEPEEIRELLRHRYNWIKTHRKANIESPIESEYDTNQDGIIDSQEAQILKEDLQE